MIPPDLATAYTTYHAALVRFCAARVGPDAAEDVVQDLWLEAWRTIERYEDRGYELSAWLYRIARSRCIDWLRRRNRAAVLTLIDEEDHPALRLEPWEAVDARIDAPALLAAMTPRQRTVVWLRFVAGLSLLETATALGIPENAVKARQHRALARARMEGIERWTH